MKKGARRRPKFHSWEKSPGEHPTPSDAYMLASQCVFTMVARLAFHATRRRKDYEPDDHAEHRRR